MDHIQITVRGQQYCLIQAQPELWKQCPQPKEMEAGGETAVLIGLIAAISAIAVFPSYLAKRREIENDTAIIKGALD